MPITSASSQAPPAQCPVCRGDDFSRWGTVEAYDIYQCSGCGLGLTAPVPAPDELEALNRELYTLDRRIQAYLPRQRYFERRYRRCIAALKHFRAEGRLLDVGCNIGLFLKVARDQGYDVTGVELNRECAEFGTRYFGVPIRSEYLEDAASELGQFDVITLFDVLEHIPDMGAFIGSVKEVLKEEGVLVVQLPNLGSLMASMAGSRWGWLTPPDHVYHFTPGALRLFLEGNGFEVVMLRTWEPAKEFTGNLLTSFCPPGRIAKALFKVIKKLKLLMIPVLCLQHVWWRQERGGLIEAYAVKRSAGRDRKRSTTQS